MISCERCGKDNQDHYRFCLGCGAELTAPPPAPAPEPAPAPAPTPVSAQAGPVICANCNAEVPPGFKFCGACGTPLPVAAPPPEAAAPVPAGSAATLTLVLPDGTEGGVVPLVSGANPIGRNAGEMFASDGFLSPDHAVITVGNQSASITDNGSLNGVFVRIKGPEELTNGRVFRIGQELIRFDVIESVDPAADGTELMGSPNPGYWGRLTVLIGKNIDGPAYPLVGEGLTLGRERGDINFPEDGYVSGLHASVYQRDTSVLLEDQGSSNGTFLRINGAKAVAEGDFVLMGQQLFRINFPA